MRILLDTNAYSAMVRGQADVCVLVRESEHVLLSMVVIGELLAGFRRGSQYERNRRVLDEYLASPYFSSIPVTLTTADRFGRVWAGLRARGRPIPTNDVWIAAHAMETGAELVSFDRHFSEVEGLAWTHFETEDKG